MKDIKFRAWDKDGKFMTNSFYLGSLNAGDGFDSDWEVMPYTGIKDKHGVGVFEGDILSYESENGIVFCGVVVFKNGCFYLGDNPFANILRVLAKSQIIGNIYEDPELVRGQEDLKKNEDLRSGHRYYYREINDTGDYGPVRKFNPFAGNNQ